MISQSKLLVSCMACLAVVMASLSAQATTVTTDTTLSNWGTYSDYQMDTLSVAEQVSNYSLSAGRTDMYQSFRVGSEFTLTEFDLAGQVNNVASDIRIRIYNMPDTNQAGTLPTVGSTLYDHTFDTSEFTTGGYYVHRFTLAPGEQFTLSPQTSPAGYAIHMQYVNVDGATNFHWNINYSNVYADGRTYMTTENAATYDTALALYGGAVPEPSSFVLASLGLMGLVGWGVRRRAHR